MYMCIAACFFSSGLLYIISHKLLKRRCIAASTYIVSPYPVNEFVFSIAVYLINDRARASRIMLQHHMVKHTERMLLVSPAWADPVWGAAGRVTESKKRLSVSSGIQPPGYPVALVSTTTYEYA